MQLRLFFLIVTIFILSFLSDRQYQVLTKSIGSGDEVRRSDCSKTQRTIDFLGNYS